MFLSGFPPQQITLQSIMNKLKQILLTVSTADCISVNRKSSFGLLLPWIVNIGGFAACVLTHFSESWCQLGKNGRHTSTFSTLITTMETEWSCFLRQQPVLMVNNICMCRNKLYNHNVSWVRGEFLTKIMQEIKHADEYSQFVVCFLSFFPLIHLIKCW